MQIFICKNYFILLFVKVVENKNHQTNTKHVKNLSFNLVRRHVALGG